jgi:hypothetical protein
MFGLPAWAIELIIAFLQKIGAFNTAEAVIGKGIVVAKSHIEKLQTYQQYPSGRNGR